MIATPARIDRNARGEVRRVVPLAFFAVVDARGKSPDRVAKAPLL